MLATNRLDQSFLDRVVAEFGQGPTTIGQSDHRWFLLGELAKSGSLLGRDLSRCSTPATASQPVQPLTIKRVQIGLDRVRMKSQETSDSCGIPAFRVEDNRFGTTLLPSVGVCLQELT